MMLCHGGLILFCSPSQIIGIAESESENLLKDLETRLGHRRQMVRSQLFESNCDKSRTDTVLKSTGFEVNLSTFNGKPLGGETAKLKAPKLNSSNSKKDRHEGAHKHPDKIYTSDAFSKQDIPQSLGGEQFRERPSSNAPDSNDEDWRSLSRALASGPKVSAISNHDLMRVAELRFSTDMKEGDSGSQVVLLQKALFWLGHLSKQSDITGYFGIETKQALREFQEAHGVSQTGLWGPLSKQALWHAISAEIMHRAADEQSSESAQVKYLDSRSKSDVFTQVWQSWTPMKLADAFKATMPEGDWRLLSGIGLLVFGIFLGLLISKFSSTPLQSNVVKRRILRSTESEKQNSAEKQIEVSSSSNGTTVVNSTLQLTSKTPAYAIERDPTGQATASSVHQKKVLPGSMYISSLGHGMQNGSSRPYGLSKKAANAPEVPSSKVSTPKSGSGSTGREQPGSWSRSSREFGSVSRTRGKSSLPPLPSSAQKTSRVHREDNESLSSSKRSLTGQNNEVLELPKTVDNDCCLAKSDGTAVTMEGEEPNVRKHIEELCKAVEAAEHNGQAAVLALAEERKRSRELEEKISRQRESAASLEEELRVLKESHDALLESLRKNIGSATCGASLLYQDFKNDGSNGAS